jgi:hypothetical protein
MTLGEKVKKFYDEHKILTIAVAILLVLGIIAIVVVAVLYVGKDKHSDQEDVEGYKYSTVEKDDRYDFAEAWVEDLVGGKVTV